MTVTDANRLQSFEDENAKLKRLLGEQMHGMAAIKKMLKKW
jgi:hypothetical protein